MNRNIATVLVVSLIVILWGAWIVYVYSTVKVLGRDIQVMQKKALVSQQVSKEYMESQQRTQAIINKMEDLTMMMRMVNERRGLRVETTRKEDEIEVMNKIESLQKLMEEAYRVQEDDEEAPIQDQSEVERKQETLKSLLKNN